MNKINLAPDVQRKNAHLANDEENTEVTST